MPVVLAEPCGDCHLLSLLQAGHGCGLHPAFPAPLNFLRAFTSTTRASHAAGIMALARTAPKKFHRNHHRRDAFPNMLHRNWGNFWNGTGVLHGVGTADEYASSDLAPEFP